MSLPPRVAIIGRGVAGLSLGIRLLQKGFAVDLYGEDGRQAASGACLGIYGVKGLWLPESQDFQDLLKGHAQLDRYFCELESLAKLPIRRQKGVLEYFFSAAHYQELRRRIYHGRFSSSCDFQLLTPSELAKAAAHTLPEHLAGAFCYGEDGFFHPEDFLQALEAANLRLGATIKPFKVDKIKAQQNGYALLGQSGNGVCDQLVVAAGAQSAEILAQAFAFSPRVKLSPGYTLRARYEGSDSLALRVGRRGLVAAAGQISLGSFKLADASEEVEAMLASAGLPKKGWRFSHTSGVRIGNARGRPIVGALPGQARVWLFFGFYKDGFSLADVFAARLADAIKAAS